MFNEISQSHKKYINVVWFHLHVIPRVVKFIKRKSRMVVCQGLGKGELGIRV